MQASANTTVTIFNCDSIDPYTGARVNEVVTVAGVAAHLAERPATRPRTGSEGRAVQDPNSDTPRILRVFSARLPAGSPVTRNSRLQDDRSGRFFPVKSVRQHSNHDSAADLICELVAVDDEDP